MKVLFFEPYALNTPHFETCLELMQRHIDEGDEVIFLGCDQNLEACAINIRHRKIICSNCISKRKNGLNLLKGKYEYKCFHQLTPADKKQVADLRYNFETIKELQSYSIESFDIGYGVGSTIISNHREPNLFLKDVFGWKALMKSAFETYLSIKNQIRELKAERVYLFNGRFSIMKAGLSACAEMGVDCFVHERGSRINKFMVYKNHQPHDIEAATLLTNEYWKNGGANKEILGRKFYEDRRKGNPQSWKSFTKDQKKNLLPANWDNEKENIVIFNSSEDEFASIGQEWSLPFYKNQVEGISKIIADLSLQKRIHFYLRIHPNLTNVKGQFIDDLNSIHGENFTIIPPESDISTYALMDHCSKILTFGSTAGIEGTFWGKPSIMAGVSLYKNQNAVYQPKSHEELLNLITSNLKPLPKESALPFGFYMNTFGEEFKYYKAESLFEGKFHGKKIEASFGQRKALDLYQKVRQLTK